MFFVTRRFWGRSMILIPFEWILSLISSNLSLPLSTGCLDYTPFEIWKISINTMTITNIYLQNLEDRISGASRTRIWGGPQICLHEVMAHTQVG